MAKTLLKLEHGVRLEWIDVPAEGCSGTGGPHYRICTLRTRQPWIRTDRAQAEREWVDEVAASKRDPTVARLIEAGF